MTTNWRILPAVSLTVLLVVMMVDDVFGKGRVLRRKHLQKRAEICERARRGKFAEISCRNGGKLFEVNITSAIVPDKKQKCKKNSKPLCVGEQEWNLVESRTCPGHSTCSGVHLEKKPIITSTPSNCSGLYPDVIYISAMCTKRSVNLLSFRDDGGTHKTVVKSKGIVWSPQYPWLYPKGNDTSYEVKFPEKKKYFHYTLRIVDVAEFDSLVLRTGSGLEEDLNSTAQGRTQRLKRPGSVSLVLSVKLTSTGANGYVLCFVWTNKKVTFDDVCAKLIETPRRIKIFQKRK